MQSEFDEFLMFELSDINTEILDHNDRVYGFVSTIAAGGSQISESLYAGYAISLEVQPDLLVAQTAYMHGMKLLQIVCDCITHKLQCMVSKIEANEWYTMGCFEYDSDSELYRKTQYDIMSLKAALGF